jgi:hypothetical protein
MHLDLPNVLPEWASVNEDALLEPELSDKQDGFPDQSYLPAKWINWLLNNMALFSKKTLSSALGYWLQDSFETLEGNNIHYNPFSKKWLMIAGDGTPYGYYAHYGTNHFGFEIEEYVNLPTIDLQARTLSHDQVTGRWIVAGKGGVNPYTNLAYSVNGSTWVRVLVGSAAAATIYSLGVKTDSDKIIVWVYGQGFFIADSVTSAFTVATTNITTGYYVMSIKHVIDTTWVAVRLDGTVCYSNDDGVNWYTCPTSPTGLTDWESEYSFGMDVNPGTNTIVVTGRSAKIAVSHDGGNTWAYATTQYTATDITNTPYYYKALYIGGGAWVIGGYSIAFGATPYASFPGLWVSIDDGDNWFIPIYGADTFAQKLHDIDCDGKRVIGIGEGVANTKMLTTAGRIP